MSKGVFAPRFGHYEPKNRQEMDFALEIDTRSEHKKTPNIRPSSSIARSPSPVHYHLYGGHTSPSSVDLSRPWTAKSPYPQDSSPSRLRERQLEETPNQFRKGSMGSIELPSSIRASKVAEYSHFRPSSAAPSHSRFQNVRSSADKGQRGNASPLRDDTRTPPNNPRPSSSAKNRRIASARAGSTPPLQPRSSINTSRLSQAAVSTSIPSTPQPLQPSGLPLTPEPGPPPSTPLALEREDSAGKFQGYAATQADAIAYASAAARAQEEPVVLMDKYLRSTMSGDPQRKAQVAKTYVSHVDMAPVHDQVEHFEGDQIMDNTWSEITRMLVCLRRKNTAERDKEERFEETVGPRAMQEMGVPRESVILIYRMLLTHCTSFHDIIAELVMKREEPPPTPATLGNLQRPRANSQASVTPSASSATPSVKQHPAADKKADKPNLSVFAQALELFADPEMLRRYTQTDPRERKANVIALENPDKCQQAQNELEGIPGVTVVPELTPPPKFDAGRVLGIIWRMYARMWDNAAIAKSHKFRSELVEKMNEMRERLINDERLREHAQTVQMKNTELEQQKAKAEAEIKKLNKEILRLEAQGDADRKSLKDRIDREEARSRNLQELLADSKMAERKLAKQFDDEKNTSTILNDELQAIKNMLMAGATPSLFMDRGAPTSRAEEAMMDALQEKNAEKKKAADQLKKDEQKLADQKKAEEDKNKVMANKEDLVKLQIYQEENENLKMKIIKLEKMLGESKEELHKERESFAESERRIAELKKQLKMKIASMKELSDELAGHGHQKQEVEASLRKQQIQMETDFRKTLTEKEMKHMKDMMDAGTNIEDLNQKVKRLEFFIKELEVKVKFADDRHDKERQRRIQCKKRDLHSRVRNAFLRRDRIAAVTKLHNMHRIYQDNALSSLKAVERLAPRIEGFQRVVRVLDYFIALHDNDKDFPFQDFRTREQQAEDEREEEVKSIWRTMVLQKKKEAKALAEEKSDSGLSSVLESDNSVSSRDQQQQEQVPPPKPEKTTLTFQLSSLQNMQDLCDELEQWLGRKGAAHGELKIVKKLVKSMHSTEAEMMSDIETKFMEAQAEADRTTQDLRSEKETVEGKEERLKAELDDAIRQIDNLEADLARQKGLAFAAQADAQHARETATTALAAKDVLELSRPSDMPNTTEGRQMYKGVCARLELALSQQLAQRTLECEEARVAAGQRLAAWLRQMGPPVGGPEDATPRTERMLQWNQMLDTKITELSLLIPSLPNPLNTVVEIAEGSKHQLVAPVMLLERSKVWECRYAACQTDNHHERPKTFSQQKLDLKDSSRPSSSRPGSSKPSRSPNRIRPASGVPRPTSPSSPNGVSYPTGFQVNERRQSMPPTRMVNLSTHHEVAKTPQRPQSSTKKVSRNWSQT